MIKIVNTHAQIISVSFHALMKRRKSQILLPLFTIYFVSLKLLTSQTQSQKGPARKKNCSSPVYQRIIIHLKQTIGKIQTQQEWNTQQLCLSCEKEENGLLQNGDQY